MPRPEKLVLVTATHHPLHKMWLEMCRELSSETGLPLEVREEDYVLLAEYGEKDEFGGAWVPQLLAQMDDGSYALLLSRLPLNEKLQPDPIKGKEMVLEKLRSLGLHV